MKKGAFLIVLAIIASIFCFSSVAHTVSFVRNEVWQEVGNDGKVVAHGAFLYDARLLHVDF